MTYLQNFRNFLDVTSRQLDLLQNTIQPADAPAVEKPLLQMLKNLHTNTSASLMLLQQLSHLEHSKNSQLASITHETAILDQLLDMSIILLSHKQDSRLVHQEISGLVAQMKRCKAVVNDKETES